MIQQGEVLPSRYSPQPRRRDPQALRACQVLKYGVGRVHGIASLMLREVLRERQASAGQFVPRMVE